jgi:hypothetical protein
VVNVWPTMVFGSCRAFVTATIETTSILIEQNEPAKQRFIEPDDSPITLEAALRVSRSKQALPSADTVTEVQSELFISQP